MNAISLVKTGVNALSLVKTGVNALSARDGEIRGDGACEPLGQAAVRKGGLFPGAYPISPGDSSGIFDKSRLRIVRIWWLGLKNARPMG